MAVSSKPKQVAIIGAGPSGLILALGLHKQGISSTIYERRAGPLNSGGGVVLSPNALKVLEPLGIYQRLLPYGYEFENSDIISEDCEVLDRHYYGHQRLYGYKALRIRRYILCQELTDMVLSNGIEIRYDSKFGSVKEDTEEGVVFEINGQPEQADVLVGADGIHSSVRKHIADVQLTYGGFAGIITTIPIAEIRWPKAEHPLACAVRGSKGALLLVPEDPEATVSMGGIQRIHPELDRAGWDELQNDKEKLESLIRQDYESWGPLNKSIVDAMIKHKDTAVVWPFYVVPKLEEWTSESRRVIIVGDSAHAVPPSTGQGVSQAAEDVYSLSILLGSVKDHIPLKSAVAFWQSWRQNRLKELDDLAKIINIKRMPEEERKKHTDIRGEDLEKVQTGEGQYAWLFNTNIPEELNAWISSQ